jgi:hypothetical protein
MQTIFVPTWRLLFNTMTASLSFSCICALEYIPAKSSSVLFTYNIGDDARQQLALLVFVGALLMLSQTSTLTLCPEEKPHIPS